MSQPGGGPVEHESCSAQASGRAELGGLACAVIGRDETNEESYAAILVHEVPICHNLGLAHHGTALQEMGPRLTPSHASGCLPTEPGNVPGGVSGNILQGGGPQGLLQVDGRLLCRGLVRTGLHRGVAQSCSARYVSCGPHGFATSTSQTRNRQHVPHSWAPDVFLAFWSERLRRSDSIRTTVASRTAACGPPV